MARGAESAAWVYGGGQSLTLPELAALLVNKGRVYCICDGGSHPHAGSFEMWLLAGTALLAQSVFEAVSVKSWTSHEVGGVRKVIDLPGECRSVSQKNADRFHARMKPGSSTLARPI